MNYKWFYKWILNFNKWPVLHSRPWVFYASMQGSCVEADVWLLTKLSSKLSLQKTHYSKTTSTLGFNAILYIFLITNTIFQIIF